MTHLPLRIAVPALAAALTLLPSPALAQPAPVGTSYATIDAIETTSRTIWITGIIEGGTAPTRTSYFLMDAEKTMDRCERFALLAMSKPGKYQLTLINPSTTSARCMLSVRAP